MSARAVHSRRTLIGLSIGIVAGFLSGLFGIGGGTVIVPLLVLLAGFDQRRAAGTSLAAIVPPAAIGVIVYAAKGEVAWVPALLLAGGGVAGAQLGAWLLPKIPLTALRWSFAAFLALVAVGLFLVVPERESTWILTPVIGAALILLGCAVGVISAILGVGGGIIVVPALVLVFGVGDLEARGTSLLMMIPSALSGTIGNARRRNVDLVMAITIAVPACPTAVLGALAASALDPVVGNVLFALLLLAMAAQLVFRARRR